MLDLACGSGRHAIWIAQQGYQVDAIDRDARAVSVMAGIDISTLLFLTLKQENGFDQANNMTVL